LSQPAVRITKRERPIQHKTAPAPKTTPIRVRATRLGYYDEKRRRAGDVFTYRAPVVDGVATLPSWLEEASSSTPLKETGAQTALTAATDDVRNAGAAAAANQDDLGI
jgi:hypothetical protein